MLRAARRRLCAVTGFRLDNDCAHPGSWEGDTLRLVGVFRSHITTISTLVGIVLLASGCGRAGSPTTSAASQPQASVSSDATPVTRPAPEGLCADIPPSLVAQALGMRTADVQECSVEGGGVSPAAAARLVAGGEYDFYNLYLTPDEGHTLWTEAVGSYQRYAIAGHSCFDAVTGNAAIKIVTLSCDNPAAHNIVTVELQPIPRTNLPTDAPARARAVAEAVFPKVFTYRG